MMNGDKMHGRSKKIIGDAMWTLFFTLGGDFSWHRAVTLENVVRMLVSVIVIYILPTVEL